MKNKLLTFVVLALSMCFISLKTFSQAAPGGAGDGSSEETSTDGSGIITGPVQPCAVSFKRNNGNGTCGGDAQIRLAFNQRPDYAPALVAIFYNGSPVNGVMLPIEGDMSTLNKGYISYCLDGSNIPPAKKLKLQFHYQSGQSDCIISE